MDMIKFLITSNVNSFVSERRFPKDISVEDLKSKLELLTGASPANMMLELRTKDNDLVACLDDPNSKLSAFQLEDDMKIRVVDTTQQYGDFEDLSKVEKFELSEDAYAKRNESLRAFKLQNKLGQFNEERKSELEAKKQDNEKLNEELAQTMKIGDRCEVKTPGQPTRRGTVMYVGDTQFKPGIWVGVRYDEPHGKNDGSVQGKRYFECLPKYGGFLQPRHITVGDFPVEEDINDEL